MEAIVTGFKLVNFPGIVKLWRTSRSEALILIATATTIAATDMLIGVMTGIALALAKLLWTFTHLAIRIERSAKGGHTIMHLVGAATFVRMPYLADELDRVPADAVLHIDMTALTYIDHACLELMMEWEKRHHQQGGRLVLDWDSLHARFRSPRKPASPAA